MISKSHSQLFPRICSQNVTDRTARSPIEPPRIPAIQSRAVEYWLYTGICIISNRSDINTMLRNRLGHRGDRPNATPKGSTRMTEVIKPLMFSMFDPSEPAFKKPIRPSSILRRNSLILKTISNGYNAYKTHEIHAPIANHNNLCLSVSNDKNRNT